VGDCETRAKSAFPRAEWQLRKTNVCTAEGAKKVLRVFYAIHAPGAAEQVLLEFTVVLFRKPLQEVQLGTLRDFFRAFLS
jgi:hypothetical protein